MDLVLTHIDLSHKGGGEVVILDIAKKFNPVIYVTSYTPELTFPEFKEFDIRVLPKTSFEKLPLFGDKVHSGLSFYTNKLKDNYDVISAHYSPAELIRNKNPRVCWVLYSPFREVYDIYEENMASSSFLTKTRLFFGAKLYRTLSSQVVPKIEKICPISEVVNLRLKKYLHRDDGEIIHPGIDASEYSCGSYDKYFFYPSRLCYLKRFEIAIDAFRKFSEKHKDWKLVIAGFVNKRDEWYLPKLREFASNSNVEIIYNPTKKHLQKLYSNCYATVFSAYDEDFGLVLLEAMASKKPVISINEGGPKYIIDDNNTGYLVNSSDEMAEKMSFLASNPGLCEKLGKAGRSRVIKKFTKKKFLNKLEIAFKDVAKNHE
ncbi:MAG: glycosyltransferase family 4 protein [Candidatus Micrarchaeota archaeon]